MDKQPSAATIAPDVFDVKLPYEFRMADDGIDIDACRYS
jgi:hypothetical protein